VGQTVPPALGRTGLTVSAAGFGCYRIDPRVDEHAQALELALTSGVNLIDTSTNYGDGGSEELVGRVLGGLIAGGRVSRDQVVVVTKAGYVQGSNYETSQQRKAAGRPWPELVEYGQGLAYCIHPEFLGDQLTASLGRLGLKRVDVFLLHNPEYYLGWAHGQGMDRAKAREEFDRRLAQAFAHLEDERRAGRIGCYGLSCNTLPTPPDHPEHVSLERVAGLAEEMGADHGFQVVQMPMNLLETGAASLANQPSGATCLQAARRLGLGVLLNRPLNAIAQGRLFRLAASGLDGPAPEPGQVNDLLMTLMDSEDVLRTSLAPNLGLSREQEEQVAGYLSVAGPLLRSWRQLAGLEHWRQVEGQLTARLNAAVGFMAQRIAQRQEGLKALDDHMARARTSLEAVSRWHAVRADRRAAELYARAAGMDSEWASAPNLSQLALRALRSTAGVSCVLVGMRRPDYVRDVLAELGRPVEPRDRREAWSAMAVVAEGWEA